MTQLIPGDKYRVVKENKHLKVGTEVIVFGTCPNTGWCNVVSIGPDKKGSVLFLSHICLEHVEEPKPYNWREHWQEKYSGGDEIKWIIQLPDGLLLSKSRNLEDRRHVFHDGFGIAQTEEYREFRLLPLASKEQWRPWTFEEAPKVLGAFIKRKSGDDRHYIIKHVTLSADGCVDFILHEVHDRCIYNGQSPEQLLNHWQHVSGDPCGEKVPQ